MVRYATLAMGAVFLFSASAFAVTRTVDNHSLVNTSSVCTKATFASINLALLASASGDTIQVCPGTYPESLYINKSITITGLTSGNNSQTIIKPLLGISTTELDVTFPASAVIVVDGVNSANLNNLVVDGSLASTQNVSPGCSPDNLGIYYRNSSGKIYNSVVRYIGLMPGNVLTGCQEGQGIYADSGNGGHTTLKVFGTSVHDYDKNGITANDAGTSLDAEYNVVSGVGPTSVTAQNGIQVYLAEGNLIGNTVLDNNYVTPPGGTFYTATNILLYQAADSAIVHDNVSSGSNTNILTYLGNKGVFTYNIVSHAFDPSTQTGTGAYGSDGIDIYGDSNSVEFNSVVQSQTNAVFLCGSSNYVRYNNIADAAYGVYEDESADDGCPASGSNTISGNTIMNVGSETATSSSALSVLGLSVDTTSSSHRRANPSPMK